MPNDNCDYECRKGDWFAAKDGMILRAVQIRHERNGRTYIVPKKGWTNEVGKDCFPCPPRPTEPLAAPEGKVVTLTGECREPKRGEWFMALIGVGLWVGAVRCQCHIAAHLRYGRRRWIVEVQDIPQPEPPLDWTKPIVAVWPDGKRKPVSLQSRTSEMPGYPRIVLLSSREVVVTEDGWQYPGKTGLHIENVPEPAPGLDWTKPIVAVMPNGERRFAKYSGFISRNGVYPREAQIADHPTEPFTEDGWQYLTKTGIHIVNAPEPPKLDATTWPKGEVWVRKQNWPAGTRSLVNDIDVDRVSAADLEDSITYTELVANWLWSLDGGKDGTWEIPHAVEAKP